MNKRIITIGRQCGSGGHTIGKEIADKMGIPFYDKKLLEMIAQRSGLSEKVIAEEGEYASTSLLFNLAMGYDLSKREFMPLREQIHAFQVEMIRELAEKESCVIIGRCSDYILRERTDCLNVFIYGNTEDRINRVITEHRIPAAEAASHIADRDTKRARHYKYITDRIWGNAPNYNLCLDSSCLGLEHCVKIIIDCM